MAKKTFKNQRERRRGLASVELMVCLPFLIFIFLMMLDYCRIFYGALNTGNSARNAGYELEDPNSGYTSPYADYKAAGHADFDPNIPSSALTVNTSTSTGDPNTTKNAEYATVDCGYQFNTISKYPGLPVTTNLDRIVTVRIAPSIPK